MRHVGHSMLECQKLAGNLYSSIDGHQQRGWYGQNSPEINAVSGKCHGIGQQQRIDGSGGSYQKGHVGTGKQVYQVRYDATEDARYKVHQQEFLGANGSFHRKPEEEQSQHVEQQVGKVPVNKHIGEELPVHVVVAHQHHVQRQIGSQAPADARQQEYQQVQSNEDEGGVEETIPEGSSDVFHDAHGTKLLLLPI